MKISQFTSEIREAGVGIHRDTIKAHDDGWVTCLCEYGQMVTSTPEMWMVDCPFATEETFAKAWSKSQSIYESLSPKMQGITLAKNLRNLYAPEGHWDIFDPIDGDEDKVAVGFNQYRAIFPDLGTCLTFFILLFTEGLDGRLIKNYTSRTWTLGQVIWEA